MRNYEKQLDYWKVQMAAATTRHQMVRAMNMVSKLSKIVTRMQNS